MLRLAALRRQASTSARASRAPKPKKAKAQAPPSEIKLTLAPRGADRDLQILRSTFASFSELVHKEKEQEVLLDVKTRLGAPVAERLLDLCTAAPGQPRSLVHLLVRLDSQVQFSRPRSKEALRMLRQRGDAVDLRQLRRSLQQRQEEDETAEAAAVAAASMPPLLLDVSDVNDAISLCVQRGEMDEAVKWFITMQDALRLTPSDLTCGLMLPALIRRSKWEALFYLLAEMRVLGLAVPPRAHDLLLAECEKVPHSRWRYAQRLLSGLLEASRADLQTAAADGQGLVLRNMQRSLGVLRGQGQHAAVVETWAALKHFFSSIDSSSRGLLWDKEVVLAAGISAVVLGKGEVVVELVRGPGSEGLRGMEGVKEGIRRGLLSLGSASSSSSSSSSSSGGSIGVRCGLGLSWLMAHGEPALALELHASLGLRGEALSDLLLVLGTCLSDSALGEGRGAAHLEAAARIVREALGGGAEQAALMSSSDALGEGAVSTAAATGRAIAPVAEAAAPRLSAPMAAAFVALFGKTQDAHGTALVLLHCSQQAVPLTEEAFLRASQTLLQQGDLALVLRLLEGYLLQLDGGGGGDGSSGSKGGVRPKFAHCNNPLVFSPALSALARLGELDTMMTILLKEMPRRHCRPSPLLFTIAVDACRYAGRHEEGFRLFELSTQTAGMDRTKSGLRNDVPVLVGAVLQLCAQGRMGRQALKVVAWVDENFPSLSVLRAAQRDSLGLVIAALASAECIALLPPLLDILRAGQQPLTLTRRLYTSCLAAALVAGNEGIYQSLWAQQQDGEIEASRGEIEEEARAMAAAAAVEGGPGELGDAMSDDVEGMDETADEPDTEIDMVVNQTVL